MSITLKNSERWLLRESHGHDHRLPTLDWDFHYFDIQSRSPLESHRYCRLLAFFWISHHFDTQSTARTPDYLTRVVMDVYPYLFEISSLWHSEHCTDTTMFPIPPIIPFTWQNYSTPAHLRDTAEGINSQMVRFVFRFRTPSVTNDLHDLPQWFQFVFFFAIIFCKDFRDIVNRQRPNNIRNGIVWAQAGHSTCTCKATSVCDWTLNTRKIRIVQKKKFRSDKIRMC